MQIVYTALRSIQSGHTVDTDYTINLNISVANRLPNIDATINKSISGARVTTLRSSLFTYDITSTLVSTSTTPDIDDLREFLDSVKHGEQFTLDISGATVTYTLDKTANPYQEVSETVGYYRYSFRVIGAS